MKRHEIVEVLCVLCTEVHKMVDMRSIRGHSFVGMCPT